MNVKDIHTINWQMSLSKPDTVVTGIDDVRQCIDVILKTRKGEDPLRPHFGCGLFDWIDKPVNSAIPNMKKEILEALARYEPRVKVNKLLHEIVEGGVKFGIVYKLPDGESDFFEFSTAGGGVSTGTEVNQLILQAVYEDALRYNITLTLNGSSVLPNPPVSGFAGITDLFAWVTNYWYLYGYWHWLFAQKKIVAYIPTSIAATGSLSIQSINDVLSAVIPSITDTSLQQYVIVFKDAGGNRITPFNGEGIITVGAILAFCQANYSQYGAWTIEGGDTLTLTGSVPLTGFTLSVLIGSTIASFSQGFNLGFES